MVGLALLLSMYARGYELQDNFKISLSRVLEEESVLNGIPVFGISGGLRMFGGAGLMQGTIRLYTY